jgi:hypothetical protein
MRRVAAGDLWRTDAATLRSIRVDSSPAPPQRSDVRAHSIAASDGVIGSIEAGARTIQQGTRLRAQFCTLTTQCLACCQVAIFG